MKKVKHKNVVCLCGHPRWMHMFGPEPCFCTGFTTRVKETGKQAKQDTKSILAEMKPKK